MDNRGTAYSMVGAMASGTRYSRASWVRQHNVSQRKRHVVARILRFLQVQLHASSHTCTWMLLETITSSFQQRNTTLLVQHGLMVRHPAHPSPSRNSLSHSQPTDVAAINNALGSGQDLILTPGIYHRAEHQRYPAR